ncbi:formate dehydrogenase subunit delta [Bosea sp. Root483D1]|uniref:formate dehydrogenase subunit delta n=1 Tax=Bosea sp. Root483D1 TaxID=1736544 RepID=UPI000B1D0A31|nr:formate dehydrogenase subunit delta [Bosea sp. Root483D1]
MIESSEAMTRDHASENLAKLASMANQISDFFKSYPDEEAIAAIADHINQFWTKRMREDFRTGFKTDASALSPLVQQARDKVRPAPAG